MIERQFPLDISGPYMAQPPQFCPPPNLQRLLLQHLAEHLPRARVLKPESMQLYSLADTAENIRKHLKNLKDVNMLDMSCIVIVTWPLMLVEEKRWKKHLKGKEWLNDVKCQVARWYAHTIICKESLPLRIWDNSSSNAVSPLTV